MAARGPDYFEDVRAKLTTTYVPAAKEEEVAVRRYVAMFERLGLLLDKDVISPELAEELYGSRLKNLVTKCQFVREMVADKNDTAKPAWRNFVLLWTVMEERWNDDRRQKPPKMPG